MNMPQIEIQQQNARTAIHYSRPQMSIRQPSATLEINQDLAGTLNISRTASKMYIDQSEAFADANLKAPLRQSKEWSQAGKQAAMAYIAKTAGQGEQLKKIENGTNALPSIARQNGEKPQRQAGLVMMPESAFKVRFNFVPSELNIESKWGKPTIHARKNDPEIHIPKWQTDVYLEQKNWISFSVAGRTVNQQL
ncbi:DUF6470 family protein [Evansella clarkii]|uniref:DUF6470 family protein n=1 Tax=Evansella clarkii TaxID=79879 RepID=UPI000B434017|nr:DUF6470 family protein [Evansella clarkii]